MERKMDKEVLLRKEAILSIIMDSGRMIRCAGMVL
jgi:hypothetical protein